jgi:alpha-1,6-mannosyltransferase
MPSLSRLTDRPTAATVVIAGVGVVGSALVARASYVVGTLPGHHLDRAAATGAYRWPYEIGVALLVLAWLALGRLVLDPTVPGMTRRVCWAAAAMAAPLLVAAPVTSQDVWSYLAQANVAAHGLDPYSVGPNAVPGPFAHAVAHEWTDHPSPYGPLWVGLSRVVVQIAQPHPWAGMFLLRLVAAAGIVATGFALTRLCRATGWRAEVALWLTLAGPFALLMLVGAVHNDSVMLALLVGGVTVAATVRSLRTAILVGAVLVGAAAAVKVTALVALPFLPLVWHWYAADSDAADPANRRPPTLGRWIVAGTASVTAGVAALLLTGPLLGFDLGWISQVGDGTVGVSWLSVPQQVGNLLHLVAPDRVAGHARDRYSLMHPIGLALLALGLAVVTLTARRRPPLRTLTWVTLLLVVSSPAPRPWYLLWPLVFLAADRLSPRALVAVVAGSATLALWFPPAVHPAVPEWILPALFFPLAALIVLTVLPTTARRPTATPPSA